ncbi:MAG: UDP-N-acetylmuramoyl-L-alanyl-D-glutamate--2,6-diaminopimelate ligase [Bacteroidetes bacterium]|nr:UDP-N-acetylmuramoyl-L-alanyl-D-glutamate--2,6-diaminopimelate ligase [Bacteroidota bacterium]
MKTLREIVNGITLISVRGNLDRQIEMLTFDSRNASKHCLFFAIKGTSNDGHDYISAALENGCRNFVVQDIKRISSEGINAIEVADTSLALGIAACNFFENPSKKIKLIGVTGTNGKTTTTTLLHNLFSHFNVKVGLLSTVINKIGNQEIPSTHTTPDPIQLNALLKKMYDRGCEYCFMEVSSHAIHQQRTAGLDFNGAVFTNITHDHLDYHQTFSAYINVKKSFFDGLGSAAFALTNADDKNGMVMLQNTKAKKLSYAIKTPADIKGKIIENAFSGLVLQINNQEVYTKLVGEFNSYNLLAVYGVAISLGFDALEVLIGLSNLNAVDGRFQYFRSQGGITVIVDYAHTPDALENVLKTVNAIKKESDKVFTLVGCGGDRDKTKRPLMAKIAAKMSQQVILTSDNPRTEDPLKILNEMEAGLTREQQSKTLTVPDRKQGIKSAILLAQPGDIILIAGKGHEKYQEINGVKHDFDDFKITKELTNDLNK